MFHVPWLHVEYIINVVQSILVYIIGLFLDEKLKKVNMEGCII
jgi:hypothetical protein